MNRISTATVLIVAAVVPAAAGCGKTATAAVGAGAAAAAAIAYGDRGATSKVDASVNRTADATEAAFRSLGIQRTEREAQSDGIELKGAQEDWKIVVDIERDPGDTLTAIEVTVSKDQVNYSKDRAEQILRAILQRV